MDRLKIGDTVSWRGCWGRDAAKDAKIRGIELVAVGKKEGGREVNSVSWDTVKKGKVVVDLDNGHWAYGNQIKNKKAIELGIVE